jgi:hypothetical protein
VISSVIDPLVLVDVVGVVVVVDVVVATDVEVEEPLLAVGELVEQAVWTRAIATKVRPKTPCFHMSQIFPRGRAAAQGKTSPVAWRRATVLPGPDRCGPSGAAGQANGPRPISLRGWRSRSVVLTTGASPSGTSRSPLSRTWRALYHSKVGCPGDRRHAEAAGWTR